MKWDDGVGLQKVSTLGPGCPACYTFQGVQFTLPEGLSTAVLKSARVYAGDGKAEFRIWVTDSAGDTLLQPGIVSVSGAAWYTFALPDTVVPDGFFIWVEIKEATAFRRPPSEPYYDSKPTGHSYYGDSPSHYPGRPAGDLLIRAVIIPQVHVGPGQDYGTIQEAIDSVWDGWTILVHDGAYSENVLVDKGVTIKSLSGPSKTTVQTSATYPGSDVFTIAASCVTLSGFTIRGTANTGSAGVRIEDANGCVVSNNLIEYMGYGIYVSEGSSSNILLENACTFNTNGMYIDGSGNYISGNSLHGNTGPVGAAVYLSALGSGNQLRFNTVTVDPGTDPAVAASAQIYGQNSSEEVSAIENWWGTDSGPSNAGGQGPLVGENILFSPWLTKQPLRVKTAATGAGSYVVNAISGMNVSVVKQGTGTPVVSTASFGENPFAEFPGTAMGKWIDVLFDTAVGVDQVEIRLHYSTEELATLGLKEGSLRFFWWNGEKWKKCSKTGADTKNDFVWARLNLKTKPTSNDLAGTMFAVGVPKSGFAWWLIPLIIVIVLLLLIVIRLVWVLAARRRGGYTYLD